MEPKRAGQLGTDAAGFFRRHPDYTEDQANAANTALSLQAAQFFPADAKAIVIEHERGLPLVVGADETRLYTVEVVDFENEHGPATSQARLRVLDAERARIACDVEYRGSHTFGRSRRSTWRISVGDVDLVIQGLTDEAGEPNEPEQFARHVASSLGWRFDDDQEQFGQAG